MRLMARSSIGDAQRPAALEKMSRLVRLLSFAITDVQTVWADKLRLSVPQWNILAVISEFDDDVGISVKSVAELLRTEATFITVQSKTLAARGLLQRRSRNADKRLVHLSLTPKAREQLDLLAEKRSAVDALIKQEYGEVGTLRVIELLEDVEDCLRRCRKRLQLDE